jgi:hypothetical protein
VSVPAPSASPFITLSWTEIPGEACYYRGSNRASGWRNFSVNLIRPPVKPKQLSLFEQSEAPPSTEGQKLKRVLEENAYAPDWLKLSEAGNEIIETIALGMRKLGKLAQQTDREKGAERFAKEFARLENRVVELVDRHRRMSALIRQLLAHGILVEPEAEPEYNAALDRRGLWPPDNSENVREDLPF